MFRVNSCCCGLMSLETGSLVIAIAGIVLFILQLITNVGAIGYVGIAGGVLGFVACICLLLGVKLRRPILVLIYVIITLIVIIILIIALAKGIIDSFSDHNQQQKTVLNALAGLIMFALNLALMIYFEIVVYSHFCDLKASTGSIV